MAGSSGGQDKPALELYYSYAQEDEALCLELVNRLKLLERENLFKSWYRGMILSGANIEHEIESQRDCASVILLLISPDYLVTDACYNEMQWAWEREQAGEKRVVPIILRAISVEAGSKTFPFKTTQLLPTGGRPITDWRPRDKAFQDIVMGMRRIFEQKEQREPTQSLVWNLPYTRNALFTGRANLLQQLHANLHSYKVATLTQPQAISGLGGIGKTQTAVEYAYRHRDEYRSILWVNAATRDTIITSFLKLATLLKLPEQEAQGQNIMIAAVKHWFTAHDAWLLIFDNADDLPIVEDFLPPGGKGHLLLTTRAHAPGTLANGLAVEQMDTQGSHAARTAPRQSATTRRYARSGQRRRPRHRRSHRTRNGRIAACPQPGRSLHRGNAMQPDLLPEPVSHAPACAPTAARRHRQAAPRTGQPPPGRSPSSR